MKKISILLVVLIFGLVELVFSQHAMPRKTNPGDSLRNEGNLMGAIAEYKKILEKDPNNKTIVYNLACAYSLDQQIDSCFKYLDIAVRVDTTISALVDPDFLNARWDGRWDNFENKLISMLNIKLKSPFKDVEYAKVLWRLLTLDQSYNYEIGIAGKKIGFQSPVVRALWKLKSMISENNQSELEELIEKKGWPKISDVGKRAATAAFYIVQHSNFQKQLKYLPTLKKLCEANEADWVNYAFMYDRAQMNQNLPQRYGTQMNLNNIGTGAYELYKLEDAEKVNIWRTEIGLKPLDLTRLKISEQ